MLPNVKIMLASAVVIMALVITAMYWRGVALEERVRVVAVTAERDSLKGVVATLEDANERVNATLDFTLDMHKDQIGKTDGYLEKIQAADFRTQQAQQALDQLRLTEHKDALERPFERGSAARDRLIASLCRAWGPRANDYPQCRGSGSNGDASTKLVRGTATGSDANGTADSGDDAEER